MSENLDPVRSIYADWRQGEIRSNGWADPEIESVIGDGKVTRFVTYFDRDRALTDLAQEE
jgi:hypothetical protein